MLDPLALLPADLAMRVRDGELVVAPAEKWNSPDKPVVLDAKTRKMVTGSGGYAKAGAIAAENGRKSAWKQSPSYRAAFEALIPHSLPDIEANERRMTFEKLMDVVWDAAEGRQWVDCPHFDDNLCPEKTHRVEVGKPDAKLLAFLVEELIGKAKETIETTNTEVRIGVLMAQVNVPVGLYDVSPEQAAARKAQLMEEGVIEGEWYDAGDAPEPDDD